MSRAKGNGKAVADVLADRYRLEEQVATGGMGQVWRATDLLLQRTVAVKLLRESLAEDPVVAERFRREALLAASLSHPNMAGVFDYVEENGRTGIVMAFVDGETVGQRLAREGPMDVAGAVRIASAVLAVLKVAHDAGIVHRDVKPGNVMLTETGDVKVTDFGIARSAGHHTLTETGMVMGTAHYLSPEQVSGKPATPASDLYSVGAILYEMLSGRRPYEAETPVAVAMQRLSEDPVPLRQIRRDVPQSVEQVISRAMARDPERRYASADEMRSALNSALAGALPATKPTRVNPEPTQALTVTPAVPVPAAAAHRGHRRRSYRKALLLALVMAVMVSGLAVVLIRTTGGPSTVQVPAFAGKQLAQARTLANAQGFRLSIRKVQSTAAADLVLAQDPRAGIRVQAGETVILTVSSGVPPQPQDVSIPNLEGMTAQEAEAVLKSWNLELGDVIKEPSKDVEPGVVLRTSPPVGSTVEPGSKVDIVVATKAKKDHGNNQEGN